MELALFIWFAGVVGDLKFLLGLIGIIGAASFASYIGWQAEHGRIVKWKLKLIGVLLMCFIPILLPSERTLWLMAAGYTAQTVVQSETGKKLQQLVDKKLDDMIGVAEKQLDKVVPAK